MPSYPDLPMERVFATVWQTDVPMVYLNTVGKGRVVYFPFDLDRCFWETSNQDHLALLRNAVAWANGGEHPLKVTGPGHRRCQLLAPGGFGDRASGQPDKPDDHERLYARDPADGALYCQPGAAAGSHRKRRPAAGIRRHGDRPPDGQSLSWSKCRVFRCTKWSPSIWCEPPSPVQAALLIWSRPFLCPSAGNLLSSSDLMGCAFPGILEEVRLEPL